MFRKRLVTVLKVVAIPITAVFGLLCMIVTPIAAQGLFQEAPITGIPMIDDALVSAALGTVILGIVELLKRLRILPDGTAGIWASAAGVVTFAVMQLAGGYGVDVMDPEIQWYVSVATKIVDLALLVLTPIVEFKALRAARVFPPLRERAAEE